MDLRATPSAKFLRNLSWSGCCPGLGLPTIPSDILPQHPGLESGATTSHISVDFTRGSQIPGGTWAWAEGLGSNHPKTGRTLTTRPRGRRVLGQPRKPARSGEGVVSSPEQKESKQREEAPCKRVPEGLVHWPAMDRPRRSLLTQRLTF